jgi:hypothetical protein
MAFRRQRYLRFLQNYRDFGDVPQEKVPRETREE